MRQAVLRQVADGQVGRLDDAAGVRLVEPGQHLEQRRLAGAVRPAQADTIAVADLPGDVVEQRAVAEGLGEFESWISLQLQLATTAGCAQLGVGLRCDAQAAEAQRFGGGGRPAERGTVS